jgi:hypothetical protein
MALTTAVRGAHTSSTAGWISALALALGIVVSTATDAGAASTTPAYPPARASAAAPRAAVGSYAFSSSILIVRDSDTPGTGGDLQTSGSVIGEAGDSFDRFAFDSTDILDLHTNSLVVYDTLVLDQVLTEHMTAADKQTIAAFVTGGGKLVIHDSDGTDGNDYSWLPAPAKTGQSCPDCGDTSGTATVVENNGMVSNVPGNAAYVNVDELPGDTDALGDANVMVTLDPHWYVDITATNGKGDTGAVHTYASVTGLIVFDGLDTDDMGEGEDSGVDWLSKLWYLELTQGWNPDGLPHGRPVHCSMTIATVAPASGVTPRSGRPGSTVALTGTNFCQGTTIRFGNSAADAPATVPNISQMTVTVPRNATSGPLQVISPTGEVGAAGPVFAVDSYRNTNGFQFSNSFGADDVGWSDIEGVFGDAAYIDWSFCPGCLVPGQPLRSRSPLALDVLDEARSVLKDGLCFGFTFGSLRIAAGDVRLDNTSDPLRRDSLWNVSSAWALTDPSTQTKSELFRYLVRSAASQFSFQSADARTQYARGLDAAPQKGDYIRAQVSSALAAGGFAVISVSHHKGGFLGFGGAWEGHALAAIDVEGDPADPSAFYIDLYDPNRPFSVVEDSDGATHSDALQRSRIHVDGAGNWTLVSNFATSNETWSGGSDLLTVTPLSALRGALTPWAEGSTDNAISTSSPSTAVNQVVDAAGHKLLGDDGDLAADPAQRPAIHVLALTAGGGPTGLGLLFDRRQSLTFDTTGAGTGTYGQQVFAPGFSARIGGAPPSAHNTDRIFVAPAGGVVALVAAAGIKRRVTLAAQTSGPSGAVAWEATGTVAPGSRDRLALPRGGKPVTLTHTGPASTFTLSLRHVGGKVAPTIATAHVRLRRGEQLKIRHPVAASGASRLRATVTHGKRTRRVVLRNAARRPVVRIRSVKATRGRGGRSVVLRIVTRGSLGGRLTAAVRLARPGIKHALAITSATVRHAVVTLVVPVPASAPRHGKARVYVTALDASGHNSSHIGRRRVTLR